MTAHSIWLVEYGYVDRFPASNLFAAQPNEGFRRMPYCFGVIRTADECILVDAGFWDPAPVPPGGCSRSTTARSGSGSPRASTARACMSPR